MKSCIIWQGAVNNKGYGKLKERGIDWLAHRWAYTQAYGPIPTGKILRHTCDNRRCIEPTHLITGTWMENMQDAKDRGRPLGRWAKVPR